MKNFIGYNYSNFNRGSFMLLSLWAENCMIYNSRVAFSMYANMHYRRFTNNVIFQNNIHTLKTAVIIGPNNSGKTNFVRLISMLKMLMLNNRAEIEANIFTNTPIAEVGISFLYDGKEYILEVKYNTRKKEYVYERFSEVLHDKHRNKKIHHLLIRDNTAKVYYSEDKDLHVIMQAAAKNNILIHLVDTDNFPHLKKIKDIITAFASKIDIVDMNNIPIAKTIDMLKSSEKMHREITNFLLNADLSLEDFRYLNDNEIKVVLRSNDNNSLEPQEKVLSTSSILPEMLHLVSVYKGIQVPSILFDSTGTKKMAALASYILDALHNGRILIIDELDNSLHFRLTRAIINMFNNELNNNSQLIATVHDISLLDCKTLFRKEQIWFSYKDLNDTYLYSLADFTAMDNGIRDTSDLVEKYRKGVLGALPEPDLFNSLFATKKNLIYA